jgi:hypothetical protein
MPPRHTGVPHTAHVTPRNHFRLAIRPARDSIVRSAIAKCCLMRNIFLGTIIGTALVLTAAAQASPGDRLRAMMAGRQNGGQADQAWRTLPAADRTIRYGDDAAQTIAFWPAREAKARRRWSCSSTAAAGHTAARRTRPARPRSSTSRAGLCLRLDRLPAGAAGDGGTTGGRCRRRAGGAAGAGRCAGDRPAPRGADGPQRRGAPCGAGRHRRTLSAAGRPFVRGCGGRDPDRRRGL